MLNGWIEKPLKLLMFKTVNKLLLYTCGSDMCLEVYLHTSQKKHFPHGSSKKRYNKHCF